MATTTVNQLAEEFRTFVGETKINNSNIAQKIDGLLEVIQNRDLLEAGRSHLFDKIKEHDITLYGDKKSQRGHDQRIAKLEDQMSTLIKLMWIVITPLLVAIGAGIVVLIRMGLVGGL